MQVVCAHAVSVPPTPQLSAHMSGYLPVHCIHQLIKTRTFRKYGISIKVGRGCGEVGREWELWRRWGEGVERVGRGVCGEGVERDVWRECGEGGVERVWRGGCGEGRERVWRGWRCILDEL